MSIPKEPRQIMINLMYLVLTALLALNVSNEILNAFKTLSISIDKSNKSIDQKNVDVYNAIKENEKQPGQEEKVKPYREKADEVVKQANAMVSYLDNWKRRVTMEAGGYNKDGEDTAFPQNMSNIDATTHLLVEEHGGDTMKEKITELRRFMLSQLRPQDTSGISPLMPLKVVPAKKNDHNPTGDWSIENFEHMPSIAALALFSKYKNDVRSSEALVLNQLFQEAHLKDIKFDTIGAVAVPKTSYALEGDKIEASILLAAFNKAQKPTISGLSSGSVKPADNGVIPWEVVAKGTGLQTVRGRIELNTENGLITRDWSFQYMVGTTGASMQLDKMNVFYIGVANPVTYSAAGYSVEDVHLEIPGADVRADSSNRKGHNNIWVTKVDNHLEVKIMAKTKEGPVKQVGGMVVRVKRIPDPVARVGGKSSGFMSAGLFKAQIAPAAILENFEFDASFKIISFTMSMAPKGGDYLGPYTAANRGGTRFTDGKDVSMLQNRAKAGDKVYIEEIKAVGPDGTVRTLNPIILNLN